MSSIVVNKHIQVRIFY
ncbi:hypothetical protein BLA29_012104, partial [Euroglyphus maynei]